MKQKGEKMIITTGNTYQSDDYGIFKRLEGNRPVLNARINKIKVSVRKNGYIFNPIVVNEKYQIIDGQGRFEALKDLGVPIDFVVANGAGLEQCVALNASGSIWTMQDYIDSYCELGNENYIRLRELMEAFPTLTTQVKIIIITGLSAIPNDTIKRGTLVIPESVVPVAKANLNYAVKFAGTFSRVKGTKNHYYYAVVFARQLEIDEKRLVSLIEKSVLDPAPSLKFAMDNISDIYNKKLKPENRIYLHQSYEQSMCDKYGWYGAKWASK